MSSPYPFIAFDEVAFCPKCKSDDLHVIDVQIDSMKHSDGTILESMTRELLCGGCGTRIHQVMPITPERDLEPTPLDSPARFGT